MRRMLDLLCAVVAACVTRDFCRAVEHSHFVLVSDQRQRLLHELMRDAVVVLVEAQIWLLAACRRKDECTVETVRGQTQEHGLLRAQRLRDRRLVRVSRYLSCVRDAGDPLVELAIQVGERRVTACSEKAVTQVLDRALDLAFLVATARRTWLWRKVVVPSEFQDARVKADVLTYTFEHHTFEVVVEQDARHAAQGLERFHVTAHKALECLVEREARVHRAAVAEHHHEARQCALGRADSHLAEARPIHLPLLARQRREVKVRLVLGHGPDRTHETAHDRLAATIAA
jgi:hypothetical protein